MKHKAILLVGILVTLMLVTGCSTRKNTAGTRFYHALTTRYNVYFNGNEAYKAGLQAQQQGNKDNYMDFSGVEAAVKAVVRGKNITEQSEVDKMAKAIEDAIAALEKKPASTKPGTSDKSPQTGDTSNVALWIALLFVSGGAAIGATVVSRKKKYNR